MQIDNKIGSLPLPKINLLYVMEGGRPGGAEQNLFTVIKSLDMTAYKIRVCLLGSSDISEETLKSLDIPFFVLPMRGKWNIVSIFKLVRFMRREKIHIIHTCIYASNTFGRIAAILARAPIIIAWEQGEVLLSSAPFNHFKVDRILAKFTDCIVACSEAVKEGIVKKEGISACKIRVIYNCVDLAKFTRPTRASAIRNEFGIDKDDLLIGNVASLANEVKGQEYLIRAMPHIIKVFPKTRLLLIGDGPSKSYFIQLINSLNIGERVVLTGFRKDIPELVNVLDLYVHPSIMEGLCIAVLEAMALKKPVIAIRIDALLEVVAENQTGYLVPPKDTDGIVKAVIDLLGNREKMRQMGEAGFERVKAKFTSDLIVKEIEALYKELSCKIHLKSQ